MKFIFFLIPALLLIDSASAENPKNIVLILADEIRWSPTSLFGTTLYETPNIQRLASRGMTFSQAYASPICSHAGQHHDGAESGSTRMTGPVAHLAQEIFNAVVNESGPPHQKVQTLGVLG